MGKISKKVEWRSKLSKKQVLTVPNILSFFRIALIPLIIYLYIVKNSPAWTLVAIIVSSITDIADGIIARKFNMITDFGKALDPIADKLTQGAILICLLSRFPLMWIPLVLMVIKETVAFVMRLILFRKTEEVFGAEWHGKLNTVVLYLIISLHIIWYSIPSAVSAVSIFVSSAVMVLSFVLYTISIALVLKKALKKEGVKEQIGEMCQIEKSA